MFKMRMRELELASCRVFACIDCRRRALDRYEPSFVVFDAFSNFQDSVDNEAGTLLAVEPSLRTGTLP